MALGKGVSFLLLWRKLTEMQSQEATEASAARCESTLCEQSRDRGVPAGSPWD